MLILNAEDVRRALPMKEAVEAMKQAFAALSAGNALTPPRIHMEMERNSGISLFMPAYVDSENVEQQALTIKAVSLFDHNHSKGLARIQAAVLVLEPDTGRPVAVLEGATITAIRTAAASGAATDFLARQDSSRLAVLGAGVQARSHIDAVCAVRDIKFVSIYSRTPEKVAALIDDIHSRFDFVVSADSARGAVSEADIVCSTTTAQTPVFDDADIGPGTHINAVGSYQPHVREVPPETVIRSRVVVDNREAAWEEAGDLIQPLEAGQISRDHIYAELGELVAGEKSGRDDDGQITFFKSVGISVQDAFAAQVALSNAKKLNIGQTVDW
ncbi:MAG: ornithine cyclodeaminase [Planctomycetota bacterium]